MLSHLGAGSPSPIRSPREKSATSDGTDTLFKGLALIHSTTHDLSELRVTAKKSGGTALGAVDLISVLGNHAGLGDVRETLIIAQHAIEHISRYNELEG